MFLFDLMILTHMATAEQMSLDHNELKKEKYDIHR